jgi:predicted flap endonuclease-1-like 5' DNA nuclease
VTDATLHAMPQMARIEAELEHARRVLASKLVELKSFETEREQLLGRIAQRDTRVRELEGALLRTNELAARVAKSDERISELESALADARRQAARVEELQAELALAQSRGASVEKLQAELAAKSAIIGRLEGELAETLAWSPPRADDLKKIRGIGPKLESALNAIGVTSFAQIASWTDQDVARISTELAIAPGRIRKGGWIEAARELTTP